MFLVSRQQDVAHVAQLLEDQGWGVLPLSYSDCGAPEAVEAFRTLIVVAHGDDAGVVYMCSDGRTSVKWMWPEIDADLSDSRLYLYCCSAGVELIPRFVDKELFGHIGKVPMPQSGVSNDLVTQFLGVVWDTMANDEFDRRVWREKFITFLDSVQMQLDRYPPTEVVGIEDYFCAHLLRESLQFTEDMFSCL